MKMKKRKRKRERKGESTNANSHILNKSVVTEPRSPDLLCKWEGIKAK